MREFFLNAFAASTVAPVEIIARLIVSLALGFMVSHIYRVARANDGLTQSFQTTLVLLSVLIAMVTEVIGDSVARAFSLVGALSIVRFRTVVRDTQDTAYVIFAVVVGMAVGAGNVWVAAIGISVVTAAAVLTMSRARPLVAGAEAPPEFLLSILVTLGMDLEQLKPICDRFLESRRLLSFGTARQGAALEAVYGVRMAPDGSAADLVCALNQIDGVQRVELNRPEASEE
jgi:hypothetical protein